MPSPPAKRPKTSLPPSYTSPSASIAKTVSSKTSPETPTPAGLDDDDDDLDTDTKLAILSSLFPLPNDELLELLVTTQGSLKRAQGILSGTPKSTARTPTIPARKKTGSSTQTSLSSFIPPKATDAHARPLPKPQKGKPLLLFSPEHVAALTPCTLVTRFLPTELANELLLELVSEAETFPGKGSEGTRFRLFEREVWSRHTSGFYVRGGESGDEGGGDGDGDGGGGEAWYTYNGLRDGKLRRFTGNMEKATELVEGRVRGVIRERWAGKLGVSTVSPGADGPASSIPLEAGRMRYESPQPWVTNAAVVNCYDGGGENVGWHADQVTYLGPMATIASVSLGVGREFGLKKEGGGGGHGEGGVIKVWLPHNSLLIMEAGTQEQWKHWFDPPPLSPSCNVTIGIYQLTKYSIYPAPAITTHPLSRSKRINITYRYYRPSLTPNNIPHCRCNPHPLPGVLRTVMDRSSENYRRYFWSCQGVYQGRGENGEGCGWFEWAEWDEDGELKGWRERKRLEEGNEGGENGKAQTEESGQHDGKYENK